MSFRQGVHEALRADPKLSLSVIAKQLGTTRNVVAGIVFRDHLRVPSPKTLARRRERSELLNSMRLRYARPRRYNYIVFASCQWLEGEPEDRRFCGEAVTKGSYCAKHKKMVYISK